MINTNHTIPLSNEKSDEVGEFITSLPANARKPFIAPDVSVPILVGSLSLAASPLQIDSGGDAGGDLGVNPGSMDNID